MPWLSDYDGYEPPRGIRRLSAAELLIASFVGLIALGTLGLLLLPGLYTGPRLGVVDALFTATSAVCVTGLIVVDTATYFTPLGQGWILFLVQAGGLGILTMTTLVALAIGRSTLRMEEATTGDAAALPHLDTRALVRTVVAVTFSLEAVGALLLWLDWRPSLGSVGAVWPAIFHSISAFCNAGFSIFSDSLAARSRSPVTLGVVGALIVVGGLGFPVIEDLRARWRRGAAHRLSVHTRLVFGVTAFLLLLGWALYLVFEWNHELAGMPGIHKVTNALFMSITARTAGFNTVDYGAVSNPSVFLTLILMLIGGSPGSTAGGVKTTTFGLLALGLRARLRGEQQVTIFDRSIPRSTVQRAASLVVGTGVLLATAMFILMITESWAPGFRSRAHLVELIFEAHSAFGTVGLSMGVTSTVTPTGRVVLSLLMFVGRVAPASLVAAMASASLRRRARFRYGREDVILG